MPRCSAVSALFRVKQFHVPSSVAPLSGRPYLSVAPGCWRCVGLVHEPHVGRLLYHVSCVEELGDWTRADFYLGGASPLVYLPVGVLLPALANLLTGHRSDYVALWIFRLMSIGAYAGAGVILWKLAKALNFGRFASVLLVVLFATDAKIVDFSTNGMETGFLLLFLSWTLFALIASPPKSDASPRTGVGWTHVDAARFVHLHLRSRALDHCCFSRRPMESRLDPVAFSPSFEQED